MNHLSRAAALGVALIAAVATAAGPASAAATHTSAGAPATQARAAGAVFVQTNGLNGNEVVAYDRGLHQTGTYSTGGLGGILTGAVADPLASQGSLTLDPSHRLLYAVNAGSNTVTVFAVHGSRLTRLQIVSSGGEFPVSVAVHDDLVYVLNARDGGAVQGYRRVGNHLIRVPAWHRALGLNAAATPEFVNTPGQVTFAPHGQHLLVTTKANTNDILDYAVNKSGGLSAQPVHNTEPVAKVPFSLAFDSYRHVVAAEAGPNAAATFDRKAGGHLAPAGSAATGGMATCWVTGVNGIFYFSNTGSNTVSAFRTQADGSLQNLSTTTTAGAGPIDTTATADGRTLYVQTGGDTDGVEAFTVGSDGTLTPSGSVLTPRGANSEGIAAY